MILNKRKNNIYNLFIKTLSVVNYKNKKRLITLILFLIFQSILDVITIASIVPLLYLLDGKEKIQVNMSELFENYNVQDFNISDEKLIIFIPIAVIVIMILATLSRLYIVHKTNSFIEQIRYEISSRLMDSFIDKNFNYGEKSEIAKSILSEVDQFIIIVFQPTMLMITNIFLLLGIIIYILVTNTNASLISLTFLLAFYLIFHLFTKKILNVEGFKSEAANKGRFKVAIETFQSIKDIKIYSAENFFKKRFRNYSRSFAMTNSIYNTLVASPKYLLEMIVFVALSTSILFIAFKDLIDLNSLPILGTFAFAAYKAQPALSNVIYGINSLEYGSKIISNLYKELNLKNTSSYPIGGKRIQKEFKEDYSIYINDLSYKFNDHEGLKKVNLEINHKNLFIIVGDSGSGKSTFLNLISGLLKPQEGKIMFNKSLFHKGNPKISYLHQDFSLIDASIAENVAFGIEKSKIDYKNLDQALESAEIYDYVYKLKNKIFENVGENGTNLSEGQKQRIALARALYLKPDILLLDEPTSSLDNENEKMILKTILKLAEKITIVMSTHKINFLPKDLLVGYINERNTIEIKTIQEYELR